MLTDPASNDVSHLVARTLPPFSSIALLFNTANSSHFQCIIPASHPVHLLCSKLVMITMISYEFVDEIRNHLYYINLLHLDEDKPELGRHLEDVQVD
jgi:hypothetical protein